MLRFLTVMSLPARKLKVSLNWDCLSNLKYAMIDGSWPWGAACTSSNVRFVKAVRVKVKWRISPVNGSLYVWELPKTQNSVLARKVVFSNSELTRAPLMCTSSVLFMSDTATWFQSIMLIWFGNLNMVCYLKVGVALIAPFLAVTFWVTFTLRRLPLCVILSVLPQSRIVPLKVLGLKGFWMFIQRLTPASVMLLISVTKGFLNRIDELDTLEKLAE